MAWNHIAIEGTGGVLIGAPCDGIILFTLFSIFVVAFPGSLKHKLWFIPLGILSIHIVNVMRVIALAVIVSIDESWLSFNHDYTFTILTYAWVFTLWVIWVKRFSPLRASNRTISKD
jgi:exosortase/archaeosortase family protein